MSILLFTGDIPARIQALALLGSVALLFTTLQLIRHGKLKEGYSIIWFIIALATVLVSAFPRLLEGLSRLVGIAYAPATLFLMLLGGLFLLSIHFSVMVTRYDKEVRRLAQEHAMLKEEVERNHKTL